MFAFKKLHTKWLSYAQKWICVYKKCITKSKPRLSNTAKVNLTLVASTIQPTTQTPKRIQNGKSIEKVKQSEWQTIGESNKRNGIKMTDWKGKGAFTICKICNERYIFNKWANGKKIYLPFLFEQRQTENEKNTHNLLRLRFNYLDDFASKRTKRDMNIWCFYCHFKCW